MTYADRIPAPRPIPNMSARLTDARACGHTPEQHRHDDGQAADTRSQDRRIRELRRQLDDMTTTAAGFATERDEARDERDQYAARLTTLRQLYADHADGPPISGDWLMGQLRELTEDAPNAPAEPSAPPSSVPPRRAQEDEPRSSETDVPDWVLMLVAGLARYEAEHPKLYRHKGVDQVEPYPCPCSLLEGVPAAVRAQAERKR